MLRGWIRGTGMDRFLPVFSQNTHPKSLLARLVPLNRDYPHPTPRSAKREGLRYELDISDFMEWMVYFGIGVEPRSYLLALVKPGMTVFDVGANIGEVSMKIAQAVGPSGKVVSFEPGKATFEKFRKNLSLNNLPNVEPVNLGLGQKEATLHLAVPSGKNHGGARIMPTGEAIQITTLDAFVEQNGVSRLDLIKIDVEGFEMNVLQGARTTLEKFRPLLFVEIDETNLSEQNTSAKDLLELLAQFGYRFQNAQSGAEVKPTDDFAGVHFDVIGFRK